MNKDLRIEFKFRNAALLTRLQEVFGQDASIRVMAEGAGVPYGDLCYLLSLLRSPFVPPGSKRGTEIEGIKYTKTAMTLANFFYVEPAELFPVSLYSIKFPKKYYKDFESIQLLSFQEAAEQKLLPPVESYEDNYEALGLKDRMNQALEMLTVREEKVIRLRFGLDDGKEKTYDEVAAALGGSRGDPHGYPVPDKSFPVSRERIRQIEKKALRKLRHPLRSQKVKVFYTEEEPSPEIPESMTKG